MGYSKREHYALEKILADQLKKANREERKMLYKDLYNKLFSAFPEISQGVNSTVAHRLSWKMKFLRPYLRKNKTFLEVGCGNCEVSKKVCSFTKQVIAYEVSDKIPFVKDKPVNLTVKYFDGVRFYEPDESIDIIYSNQVLEHLHPEDAVDALQYYYKMLTIGGVLVMATPNRITGPDDISRDFSVIPEGFHLHEYTYAELVSKLKGSKFNRIRIIVGHPRLFYAKLNPRVLLWLERFLLKLSSKTRVRIRSNKLVLNLFGIKIVATK